MDEMQDKRFFVKIKAGPAPGGNPTAYFNYGFTYANFNKWQWFFKYRAALIQVNHPRWTVHYTTGFEVYKPTQEALAKRNRDKYRAVTSQITAIRNRMAHGKRNWVELFPIEDTAAWQNAECKLLELEGRKAILDMELSHFENREHEIR